MLDPQSLIMRPDSLHRGEIVTDTAIQLIAEGGCRAVTLRALADKLNMTPRGVQCWFGTTDDMWEQIAACYGRRWVAWLTDLRRTDPGRPPFTPTRVQAMLPMSAEEVTFTQVWQSLGEEGRPRARVGDVVAHFEHEELEILARLQPALAAPHRPIAMAVVRSLRHSLCAATDPMPTHCAQEILTAFVEMSQSCDAAAASSSHTVSR